MHCPQTAGRRGLHYLPHLLSAQEQSLLVSAIDAQPWNGSLTSRRTQHHGYIYDYQARTVRPEHHLGPLPGGMSPPLDSRLGLQHTTQKVLSYGIAFLIEDVRRFKTSAVLE